MACWLETYTADISPDWERALRSELPQEYFHELSNYVENEYRHGNLVPNPEDIFRAFQQPQLSDVRVCILGQDPYPSPGIACGLAFSTRPGEKIQASEKAIFNALTADYPNIQPKDGCLSRWTEQGVMLLNAALTVCPPGNEHCQGKINVRKWGTFTSTAIKILKDRKSPIVFFAWGEDAIRAVGDVPSQHLVIKARHPSPQAYNRAYCKHPKIIDTHPFKNANDFLVNNGQAEIDWSL